MLFIYFIKIYLKKKQLYPFIFSLILLITVPFFGVEIKGAKRWLDLFLFRLQPIEIKFDLFLS